MHICYNLCYAIPAEVFFEFRHGIHAWSNLDADHYLGLPSLALDIFLYKSKKTIQLLDDIDMIKFFEKAIRGGLSYACDRHVESSSNVALSHIDMNNLYGQVRNAVANTHTLNTVQF